MTREPADLRTALVHLSDAAARVSFGIDAPSAMRRAALYSRGAGADEWRRRVVAEYDAEMYARRDAIRSRQRSRLLVARSDDLIAGIVNGLLITVLTILAVLAVLAVVVSIWGSPA